MNDLQRINGQERQFMTENIIRKYQEIGIDCLSQEELAFMIVDPYFGQNFTEKTGQLWSQTHTVRTIHKLKMQNVDLEFVFLEPGNKKYNVLFRACSVGDLKVVYSFYEKFENQILNGLHNHSGDSLLHLAVKSGQIALVEFLLDQAINHRIRDKLFRIPLHLACMAGHQEISDLLISWDQESLQITDLRGRKSIHFASCAPNPSIMTLIAMYDNSLFKHKDSYKRTCLHYLILNSSSEKIKMIDLALKQGAQINSQDVYGETILHYASSQNRQKIIPYLLGRGVDITLKNKEGKTALQVAASQRMKEILIVYTSAKHKISLHSQKILSGGLKGQKIQKINKENKKRKEKLQKTQNSPVSDFIQNKFYDLMKKIQDKGVQSNQHARNMSLFTGSWMEQVRSIEGLLEAIQDDCPAESLIKCFNILCPYQKELPIVDRDEILADQFYGLKFQKIHNDQIDNSSWEILLKQKDQEINRLKSSIKRVDPSLKNQLLDSQQQLREQKDLVRQLRETIEQMEQKSKLDSVKIDQLNEKFQNSLSKTQQLKQTIQIQNDTIASIGQKMKERRVIKKSKAVIKSKMKEKKVTDAVEFALESLINSCQKRKHILDDVIRKYDGDGDGRLNRYEFSGFLGRYLSTPIMIYTLVDHFGLNREQDVVKIIDFLVLIKRFNKETIKRVKKGLNEIVKILKNQGLTVFNFQQKFDHYDLNGDSLLNLPEFKGLLQELKVNLLDKDIRLIFQQIDLDDSGSIDLGEFQRRLFSHQLNHNALPDMPDLPYQIKAKKKITVSQDLHQEYNGSLKIQIFKIKSLETSWKAISVSIPGLTKNDFQKKIKENLKFFRFVCRVPIKKMIGVNISKEIVVNLISLQKSVRSVVEWRQCLGNSGEWGVNQCEKFDNGDSYQIQMKFEKEETIQVSQEINQESEQDYQGYLSITLTDILNLPINLLEDFKKVNIEIKIPNQKLLNFKTLKKDNRLILNFKKNFKLNIKKGEEIEEILILIKRKKSTFNTIVFGTFRISLRDILSEVGSVYSQKIFTCQVEEKDSPIKLQGIFRYDEVKVEQSQIKGSLIMSINRARNMHKKHQNYYFELNYQQSQNDNQSFKTSPFKSLSPEINFRQIWNISLEEQIDFEKGLQILPLIEIKSITKGLISDNQLGKCQIDWRQCFDAPLKWSVNQYHDLLDENNKILGEIYISLKFLPEGFKDDCEEFNDIDPLKGINFLNQKEPGFIQIKIPLLRNLKFFSKKFIWIQDKKLKPFLKVIYGKNERKTQVFKALNEIYRSEYEENIKVITDIKEQRIVVEIWNKNGLMKKNDFLGKIDVNLREIFEFKGQWKINGILSILRPNEINGKILECGQIYLSARYNPNSMVKNTEYPLIPLSLQQYLHQPKLIKGKIVFYLIHCQDLPKSDTFGQNDTFVEIQLNKKKVKSTTIENSNNPIFKQKLILEVNEIEDNIGDLLVRIWDKDTLKNDKIGDFKVSIFDLIDQLNAVRFNEIFKFCQKSQLYAQIGFYEENETFIPKPLIADLEEKLKNLSIKGLIFVDFLNCLGLPIDQSNKISWFVKVSMGKKLIFQSSSVRESSYEFQEKQFKEIEIKDYRALNKIKVEIIQVKGLGNKIICSEIQEINPEDFFVKFANQWSSLGAVKLNNSCLFFNQSLLNLKMGFLECSSGITELESFYKDRKLLKIQGNLIVYISHAKGLTGKDEKGLLHSKNLNNKTSDPYVQIQLFNVPPQKTKVINKNLNPYFDEQIIFEKITLDTQNPSKMQIIVKDKDGFLNSDDLIGECYVDINECLKEANKWKKGSYYSLLDKNQRQGEIFLSVLFQTNFDLNIQKPLVTQVNDIGVKEFYCNVFVDHFCSVNYSLENEKMNFYVKIHFPNRISKKTKRIKKQHHPIFENHLQEQIKMNWNSLLPFKFEIWNDVSFGKDVMLGEVECDSKNLKIDENWTIKNFKMKEFDLSLAIRYSSQKIQENPSINRLLRDQLRLQRKIKIKIVEIIGFTQKFSFLEFSMGKIKKKLESQLPQEMDFEIDYDYPQLCPQSFITILNKGLMSNTKLGMVQFSLQNIKEEPFNEICQIFHKNVKIGIMVIQAALFNNQYPTPPSNYDILNENYKSGYLHISLFYALDLLDLDMIGESDPYVVFSLGNQEIKSKIKKNQKNPQFNEFLSLQLNQLEISTNHTLSIKVLDEDVGRDDILGVLNLDIKECFDQENQWLYNELHQLQAPPKLIKKYNNFGSLAFALNYSTKSNQQLTEPKIPLQSKLQSQLITGFLFINPVHGKNLLAKDSNGLSDPFLEIYCGKKKLLKTKTVSDSLFPVWDEWFQIPLENQNKKQWQKLKVLVKDKDTMFDDDIGSFLVDLGCVWDGQDVNKVFTVAFDEGESKKSHKYLNAGLIYLQIGFRKENRNPTMKAISNITESMLTGNLLVKVQEGQDLVDRDRKGSDKSDPYVKIFFQGNDKIKPQKTQNVKDCLNPQWNETLSFNMDKIPVVDVLNLVVEIWDKDSWSSDDFMGQTIIPLMEIYQGKNQWHIQDFVEINDEKIQKKYSLRSLGRIHLSVQFKDSQL